MDYGERAKENFQSGYSCAQAVFLACTEDMGLDTETRARLASSFGGGMGGGRSGGSFGGGGSFHAGGGSFHGGGGGRGR